MSKEQTPNYESDARCPPNDGLLDCANAQGDTTFGEVRDYGPNYHNVGWLSTSILMIKTQIGLGVLSLPTVYNTLGLVPGSILLITVAGITTWSNYMVGVIKMNHPEIYGIDDVGRMLLGRIGYELFGAAYTLYFIFVAGSAMLSISISLNVLSNHATCTAVFVAIIAVVGFILSSIRTLGQIGWLAWVGSLCIVIAVFTVTIAVGLQNRPPDAPKEGLWEPDYKVFNVPSFRDAISAVSTLVFTYAGTPAFFNILAEMRQPQRYNRSLIICQITITIIYIIVGTVVHYFCGSYVASPALGSAGVAIKKISYGIALPGLIVSCVLFIHLPAKHIFVRILRGSGHLVSNSLTHWITWLGSTLTITLIAYVIASGIPIFSNLVSLIGAFFATFLTFQPYGGMWLYDNWKSRGEEGKKIIWIISTIWSALVILIGTVVMIGGTYGSILNIIDGYKVSGGSAAWSCADNSKSA